VGKAGAHHGEDLSLEKLVLLVGLTLVDEILLGTPSSMGLNHAEMVASRVVPLTFRRLCYDNN